MAVETGSRPAGPISTPSNAILLPPLLLRPFDTAHRINPLTERAVDRLDRAAPDIGMARRGAGAQRLPPLGFVDLVAVLLDDPRRCRYGLSNFARSGPRALRRDPDRCENVIKWGICQFAQ